MNCEAFREACGRGEQTAATLAHMRECSACLDFAVTVDPDNLFRSLGGDELVPDGGVDLFVDEVMQQVHVREAERKLVHRMRVPAPYRWAIAAALGIGVLTAPLYYHPSTAPVATPAQVRVAAQLHRAEIEKPIVESYESQNATIVELSNDSSDTKVVMIFDEKLPADL